MIRILVPTALLAFVTPMDAGQVDMPDQRDQDEAERTDEDDPQAQELVDSVALPFTGGTTIRQGGEPVIDTRSEPDRETVSLRTDVLFGFGSAALTPQARQVIDTAVEQIQALEPTRLIITGHTDSIDDEAFNQALSEDRAEAVDQALRDRLGADAPPSEVSGRGESEPIAPNENSDGSDNPAGRAINRRVEIEVES